MTIKSFFIGLLIAFLLYEIISITFGVIKKKKAQKNIEKEDNNNDVSKEDNN